MGFGIRELHTGRFYALGGLPIVIEIVDSEAKIRNSCYTGWE